MFKDGKKRKKKQMEIHSSWFFFIICSLILLKRRYWYESPEGNTYWPCASQLRPSGPFAISRAKWQLRFSGDASTALVLARWIRIRSDSRLVLLATCPECLTERSPSLSRALYPHLKKKPKIKKKNIFWSPVF